jgi:hypothetical protein
VKCFENWNCSDKRLTNFLAKLCYAVKLFRIVRVTSIDICLFASLRSVRHVAWRRSNLPAEFSGESGIRKLLAVPVIIV